MEKFPSHYGSRSTVYPNQIMKTLLVSIPLWFSLNLVTASGTYLGKDVSIPLWFSLNGPAAYLPNLILRFHPTISTYAL